MPARRPAPLRGLGRGLRDGLARASSRRLGPDGDINAWTLLFADPKMESGFLRSNREQLRSSLRRVAAVIFCGLVSALCFYAYGEDAGEYPAQEAYRLRRWQLALQVACFGVELSALIAAVVLSGYGLIGARGMECGAVVAMVVAELHSCINTRHYIARAFSCEDPSAVWGVDLAGSDAPFLLGLTLCVAGSGLMVRWKSLVPLALTSVFGYVTAAYLLGGPDMRLASTNLLFFAFIVLVTCSGKRSSEIQARLLHLSYLREKQMRFQAEYCLECLKDREDITVEIGSYGVGSSHLWEPVHAGCDGVQGSVRSVPSAPLSAPDWSSPVAAGCVAEATQAYQSAPLSAPDWSSPAAAGCVAEASDEATVESPGGLPLDASVWVEGRADACPLQDLERGERVLCYDLLGRSIRYAQVLEKQVDFREAPWVNVGLDDGTQLAMTAEQPLRLANQRKVVQAADLSPGTDSVVVHRVATAPVAVKEVSRQPQARGALGRAYLAVRHPDRHLVLVAGPGAGSQRDARSMAVCSADVGADPARWRAVSTRGALPHARPAPESLSPRVTRSRSEPPRPQRA